MPKKDNSALWIAGGMAAVGFLALASAKREPVRQSFDSKLRSALDEHELHLVSAELGRKRGNAVWIVTCETPDGSLLRVEVPIEGSSPYAGVAELALGVSQAIRAA